MFAALVASLFTLLFAGHSLIRLSKENMKLRGKYIDASSHRDLLQDQLNTSQGNLNGLHDSLKKLVGEFPSQASLKVGQPHGPNWQVLALRERLEGDRALLDKLLESCHRLCVDCGTMNEGATMVSNIELLTNLLNQQSEALQALWDNCGCPAAMTLDSKINYVIQRRREDRDALYKYEHLAVTTAPKLGEKPKKGAWELMQWIALEAQRLKAQLRVSLHDYDVKLAQLLESESANNTLRTQRDCYLLSRNQARDDIQGLLLFMVATKHMLNQTQLDIVRDSVIGREIPSELREAKTFDDLNVLAIKHNIMQENVVTDQPKPRAPRRRRNGS